MKINEIFKSIQGEGEFAGTPMFFIRLSGCTRQCNFCDTKYHTENKDTSAKEIIQQIKDLKIKENGISVCFTGGEPLLQREGIKEVIKAFPTIRFHLETNGDLLKKEDFDLFEYVAISPKEKKVGLRVEKIAEKLSWDKMYDIKVVTDLKDIGVDMLDIATILMPLSVDSKTKSRKIAQDVWSYCVVKNINFSPRLHTYIFDIKERGV